MALKPPTTERKLGERGYGRDKLFRTAGNVKRFVVQRAVGMSVL